MQHTLPQQSADQVQLELLPAARPRRANGRRPRASSYSAWVKRDAQLYAAIEVAEEIGDAGQANAARRRWKEHMRTMPPTAARRRGRGGRR